jgi:hypothetical protein
MAGKQALELVGSPAVEVVHVAVSLDLVSEKRVENGSVDEALDPQN